MPESLLCFRGRIVAQAVSRRPLTADVRFEGESNPCGICGGQGFTDRFHPPPAFRFFVTIIIPPVLLTYS
jgi:hypothetical protein